MKNYIQIPALYIQLALVVLFVSSNTLSAQTSAQFNFTSVGDKQTFTVPVGVSTLTVYTWGAGGGGGGGMSSDGGGGGGGGAFSSSVLNVTAGYTYTIYVGAGGAGGHANYGTGLTDGSAGESSWFSLTGVIPTSNIEGVLAVGGAGGLHTNGHTGGAGGLSTNGFGDTKFDGGNGGNSTNGGDGGGGGGESGSWFGNGNAGNISTPGTIFDLGGRGTPGADGGYGGGDNSNGPPQAGFDGGGGGGGGGDDNSTDGDGAYGGNGKVEIYWGDHVINPGPGGISTNLSLWLRADEGVSGSTWNDFGPQGNNVTDANGSDPNVTTGKLINFNPTIYYDGNDIHRAPSTAGVFTDYSIMGVAQMEGSDNDYVFSSSVGGTRAMGYNGDDEDEMYLEGWLHISNKTVTTDLKMYSFEKNTSTNLYDFKGNGSLIKSGSINNNNEWRLTIGGKSTTLHSKVYVPEAIVFNKDLSATELLRVETYLAIKYGFTLPGNYVDPLDNVIWDQTANAVYHNDVAVIGRDDYSALNQKQSKSENDDAVLTIGLGMIASDNGSNSNSFSSNHNYLAWGNNNGDNRFTSVGAPNGGATYKLLERQWVVSEPNAGEVGVCTFAFDVENKDFNIPSTGKVTETYYLIYDTDADGDLSDETPVLLHDDASNGDAVADDNVYSVNGINMSDGAIFTIAAQIVAPGGVSEGLRIWAKADAGTNTTTDNAEVNTWKNYGLGGELVALDGFPGHGVAPTYDLEGSNYNPAIEMLEEAGLAQLGVFEQANTAGTGITTFLKLKGTDGATFNQDYDVLWSLTEATLSSTDAADGESGVYVQAGLTNGGLFHWSPQNADINDQMCAITNDNIFVYSWETGTLGSYPYYVNGKLNPVNAPFVPEFIGNNFHLNTDIDGQSNNDSYDYQEVISYEQQLSDADRVKVETYLAIKYGITIDQSTATDYVDTDGNVIWNATANAAYNTNIAGIGRDDAEGLGQVKSKSQSIGGVLYVEADDEGSNSVNAFVDIDDKEYFIWGNNNGDNRFTSVGAPNGGVTYKLLERQWMVSEPNAGEVGACTFAFDVEDKDFNIPSTGNVTEAYYLIYDTDADGDLSDETPVLLHDDASNGDAVADDDVYSVNGINMADGAIFTIAAQIVAPGGVSEGLRIWAKADAGTNTTTDNDIVSTWKNYGLGGELAALADGFYDNPESPTFVAQGSNFNPAIALKQYAGMAQLNMFKEHDLSGTGASTFFKIKAIAGEAINPGYNSLGNIGEATLSATTSPFGSRGVYVSSATSAGLYHYNAELNSTNLLDPSTDNIISFLYTTGISASYPFYVNGKSIPATYNPPHSGNNFHINTDADGGPDSGPYEYQEVISYEQQLSDADRIKVETYLAVKYGVTMDNSAGGVAGDYLSVNGTIIWDADANAVNYHHDVAGIGRDDAEALGQIKSKSQNADAVLTITAEDEGSNDANAFVDINDETYLLWGNNDGVNTWNEVDAPTGYTKIARTWIAKETGETGDLTLEFDFNNAQFNISQNALFEEFFLLVDTDNDEDFSDETPIRLFDDGTNGDELSGNSIYTARSVNINDGNIFTIANRFEYVTISGTGTSTWTVPEGVCSIVVEAWGAGGGGGSSERVSWEGASGGGGGAYSKSRINVVPGTVYHLHVGSGGLKGSTDVAETGNGENGEDTWFSENASAPVNISEGVLAKGGLGGLRDVLIPNTYTIGALGVQGGQATDGIGQIRYSGGNGGDGWHGAYGHGGSGGSSAGIAADGTNGDFSSYTSTAPTSFAPFGGGDGGHAGSGQGAGNLGGDGVIPGGGAGGGGGDPGQSGGNGAQGQIKISWEKPLIYDNSTTWTAPEGVTSIDVQVWGAGGGGAGSNETLVDGQGGGGGGAYSSSTITVVPGTTYNIHVGLGGEGGYGTAGTENGNDGEDSWFSNATGSIYVLAKGGTGANYSATGGLNGIGGQATMGIGDIKSNGGNGGVGVNAGGASGAGGGASGGAGGDGGNGGNGNAAGHIAGTAGIAQEGGYNGGLGGIDDDNVNNSFQSYHGVMGGIGAGGGGASSGDNNGAYRDVFAKGGSGSNGRVLIKYNGISQDVTLGDNPIAPTTWYCSQTDVPIHGFTLNDGHACGKISISELTVHTSGSFTSSDILNFKLYYTTSSTFDSNTLLASINSPAATGTELFTGISFEQPDNLGYYWITIDIADDITSSTIKVDAINADDLTANKVAIGSAVESGLQTITRTGQPTITASNTNFCVGTEVTLSASSDPGASFLWTGGVTDGVPFIPQSSVPTDFSSVSSGPWRIASADIDGDGKKDLITTGLFSHDVAIHVNISGNDGVTAFSPTTSNFAVSDYPESVAIGDLDGDGREDVVVACQTNSAISIIRNTSSIGVISMDPKVDLVSGSGNTFSDVKIADIDGDGKLDILVLSDQGSVSQDRIFVHRNVSTVGSLTSASFATPVILTLTLTSTQSFEIADVNDNGKNDIVVAGHSLVDQVQIIENISSTGIVSFASPVSYSGSGLDLKVVDVDGDSKKDIICAANSNISVFKNVSSINNIAFNSGVDFSKDGNWAFSIDVADVNGDGKPDVVVGDENSHNISYFVNTTVANTIDVNAFSTAEVYPSGGQKPRDVLIEDFDNDGVNEVVVSTLTSNNIRLFERFNQDYCVTATSPSGCVSEPACITLTPQGEGITLSVSASANAICLGNSATLTTSNPSGDIVSYAWLPVDGLNTTTGSTVIATPSVTTTYTVTGTDANGCTKSEEITIIVNPLPIVTVNDAVICDGGSATLTGAGANTYAWSTGETTSSISVSPNTTTNYVLTGTDANGCVNDATSSVTVNPLPVITVNSITICQGASAILTASGGSSYSWSTGATTASITVSPSVTTSYTVTGTDANGCVNTVIAIVTVNPLPTVTVNSDEICIGESATLTASGASTYAWSSGETTTSIVVNPTTTTSYVVTGTNAEGCSNNATATVTVNSLPTVTVNDAVICDGGSATLTGAGANTYAWSTGETTTSISVSPNSTTNYVLTGTDVNGCVNDATSSVTVNPLPVITVNSITICQGASAILTASGGSSYSWSTGATTASITVSPSVTTSYTVTGTDANGCENTVIAIVTVNSLPTVTVNSDDICIGESATLTASGASTYAWSSGETTTSIVVNPTTTTSYVVTGTSAEGCSNDATATVTVNSLPTVTVNDAVICVGSSATLTGAGANTYAWSTGETTNSISVSPNVTSDYTITGTDANGCSNNATATVTVNSLPVVTVNSEAICEGTSATLTAAGAASYSWSTGENTVSIVVSPTTTTSYNVTGTDANGCVNTAQSTVTVGVNTSLTTLNICFGESITLTASNGNAFAWSTGDATQSITVSPTVNANYSVTVDQSGGCQGEETFEVIVHSLPLVEVNSATICSGNSATLTATGASSYLWSTGQTTNPINVSPTETTQFTVTGTSTQGCSMDAVAVVSVDLVPTIVLSNPAPICAQSSTTILASGAETYAWDPANNVTFNNPEGSDVNVTADVTTVFTVTGTSVCGIMNTATVTLEVDIVPVIEVEPIGSDHICNNQSISFEANGAETYVWSIEPATSSTDGSTALYWPSETTTYNVTGTSNCGVTANGQVTVYVEPTPAVTITSSDEHICLGQQVTLEAAGADVYSFTPTQDVVASTDNSITVELSETTTFIVSGTNLCGNTSTAETTVLVDQVQGLSATPQTSIICEGDAVEITLAGSDGTYNWSPETGLNTTTGNVVIANPLESIVYTVTGTTSNGCENTINVEVIVSCSDEIIGCCFSNYGAEVYVSEGTNLNVYCNVLNEVTGQGSNPTLLKGEFQNTGDVNLTLNWIHNGRNDLYVAPRTGNTTFMGAEQKMMGNSSTKFYQLNLGGVGTKTALIDEYNEDNLNLNNNELAMGNHTFYVQKDDPNAITGSPMSAVNTGSGFVSTDGTGALSRNTGTVGVEYLYPMGSADNVLRIRPIVITNNEEADVVSVGFNNEPPSSDNDLSKKAPNVKSLNALYYHQVAPESSTSLNKEIVSYFPISDGSFQSLAHWEPDASQTTLTYWWGGTPGANSNTTPNAAGLINALTNGEQSFDDIPFILAKSGFYIVPPVPPAPPVNPECEDCPEPPTGPIITGTGPTDPGCVSCPPTVPTDPLGPNTPPIVPEGEPPIIPYTPTPVPGVYDFTFTSTNDCGLPGVIQFEIGNNGTIDPESVKFFAVDGISPQGLLSSDVYTLDQENSGIIFSNEPRSLLEQCANAITISFGATDKDYVLDASTETEVEVFIPEDITGISLGAFEIAEYGNPTVVDTHVITDGTNNIDLTAFIAGNSAGVYTFSFTLSADGGLSEVITGQFILK